MCRVSARALRQSTMGLYSQKGWSWTVDTPNFSDLISFNPIPQRKVLYKKTLNSQEDLTGRGYQSQPQAWYKVRTCPRTCNCGICADLLDVPMVTNWFWIWCYFLPWTGSHSGNNRKYILLNIFLVLLATKFDKSFQLTQSDCGSDYRHPGIVLIYNFDESHGRLKFW